MGTVTPAEYELQTMTDRAITDGMRDTAANATSAQMARGTGAAGTLIANLLRGGAEATPEGEMPAGSLPYELLCSRHPDYLLEYWRECRALYAGGPRLFLDDAVFKRLFPRNAFEAPDLYKERCSRAFYIAYPGEVIDNLVAGFAADPIRLTSGADENGDEVELPDWWAAFNKDVSPPGGDEKPLGTFASEWLCEAFQTRTAWALVDLPRAPVDAPPAQNRLEEEERGLVDPYVCLMPAECVVDWEEDEDTHELLWALCYWRSKRRESILDKRELITERWVLWTRDEWASYRATWHPDRPPAKHETVAQEDRGAHPFGKVPLVRLTLPEGMFAMGRMHTIAREHFNKRNAVAWGEYKALFAQLYEFLEGPMAQFNPAMSPVAGASIAQDDDRATNQIRGIGYTQVRARGDEAKYVGPDTSAFKISLESCSDLMRELHRVLFSMALSANMDAAALKRSGDSKEQDQVSIGVILTKCGEIVRDGVAQIRNMIARVVDNGQDDVDEITPTGGNEFDSASVSAAIEEAVAFLNGVPQRSPTFTKRYLYKTYKLAGKGELSPEDLETIREELDTAITAESLMMSDPNAHDLPSDDPNADPEDDDEDDDEDPPAPAAKPKGGKRRMYPA